VKSIIRFFVFSNIFVAFCVLALVLSSEVLLGAANYKISQFVFFATLFAYTFQRIIRLSKNETHIRKEWLEHNKTAVYLIMIIGGAMSLYRFFNFQINTQIAIILSGIISVLYPFGLRKIPFTKIFSIAIVWTISTMLLLILENNVLLNPSVILHLISRFLFVLAITIPFDIRDLKFDNQKLKTIPIVLGIEKSKILAISFLLLAFWVYSYLFVAETLSLPHLIAILISFFIASILIIKSTQNKREIYFSCWVESLSIFFYLFLTLSSLMF